MEEDPGRHRRLVRRWFSKWSTFLAVLVLMLGAVLLILSRYLPANHGNVLYLIGMFAATFGGSFVIVKWLVHCLRGERMVHPLNRRNWVYTRYIRDLFYRPVD